MSQPQPGSPPGVTGAPSFVASPAQSTSSAQPPPNLGLPTALSRQSTDYRPAELLIGVSCMLLALCTTAVAGRLIARKVVKVALEIDDHMAILGLLLLTALAAEQIILAHYISEVTGSRVPTIGSIRSLAKLQLASVLTYALLMTVVRISILLMYRRIFFTIDRRFRIAWWSIMIVVLAYCVALLAISLTQCSPHPVDTLWLDPAKCLQGPRFTKLGAKAPMIAGFVNAIVDLCVLLLPIKMVWNLQMTNKRKILVCGLFSLGLLGVAVSIARAIALVHVDSKLASGTSTVAMFCWSISEAAVALLCACLPMQRSLFSHVYEKLKSSRGTQKVYTFE